MGKTTRPRETSIDNVVAENTVKKTVENKDSGQLKKLNQYTMHTLLGQGAYGQVYRASDDRGETVAIKVINKSVLKKKRMGPQGSSALDTLAREIAVMKKINHPHCVQLFEVIDDPKAEKVYLVMELLTGGEVMHKDNLPPDKEHLPEDAARQIFRDLVIGLEYLHAQGILHRAIKPENLVFQASPDYGRKLAASPAEGGGSAPSPSPWPCPATHGPPRAPPLPPLPHARPEHTARRAAQASGG